MYICIYIYIHTYIYMCIYVCMYVYIYIYMGAALSPYFWEISVFSWFLTNPEAQSRVIYAIM